MLPRVTVRATPYGAEAYVSLAEAVAAAKVDDPLATVTLVVPGERVGVAARRALARGVSPGRPGVAALRVMTVRRLAETLVGDTFARRGRRPLTGLVLAAAVRAVLTTDGGMFAPVAEHIGTVRAVARAYRRLRVLSEEQLDKISANVVTGETVRLHRLVRRRCAARFFDEVDLLDAAAGVAVESGSVVVFLPQDLDPPEVALLEAVARVSGLRLVVGLTGKPVADAGPLAVCRALGADDCGGVVSPPVGDVVVDASDPDDEVRHVVRRVVAALADRPGHRVGVFYGTADPYARLVHEHLARAGIEVFGRGVRPTAEGRLGRSVLRLLALARDDFPRSDVLGLVTDAPLWHGKGRVPGSAWERVSRSAGVVRGGDWTRLRDYAAHQDRWVAEHPEAEAWRVDRARREADSARSLFCFVADLRGQLSEVEGARSWREMGEAALRLWSSLLGGEAATLAPEEQRAADRIAGTLGSLSGLDKVAAEPDPVLLRELLEVDLSDDLDRVGRAGTGVHVGPVAEGVGEDLDMVFVVGVAEGLLPARLGEDPLLPDRVRQLTDGVLPTARVRVARQHRQLLATLAAAPPGGRVLSFPRGDLRQGGARVPSRWLNPATRVEVPSYTGAVERECLPATEQEWRQRAAVEHIADTPVDPVLMRAIEACRARAGHEFTMFDGNLAGETLPDPTGGEVVSATALEAWVQCPHGYFLRHLLRVAPVRQPEEVVRISAADRGTVMHDVLERLVSRAVSEGWAPGPGQPWPAPSQWVLREAAAERFARAEAEGVTGFGLLWELDGQAMLADLVESLTRDDERRQCLGGLTPVAAEVSFDNAEFPLGDGRTLRLKGRIDRIDSAADGALVVTDYKTGKVKHYLGVEADPCDRGQRLQLAVYAQAARAIFGDQDTVVRSEYWFATRRGGFRRIGHVVDPAVLDRVRQALRVVIDGITGGVFLARAKSDTNTLYECPGCDLGEHGNQGVAAAWDRKVGAVELAGLRNMLDVD